ncbi:MAG: putative DNA-binding domain-containing protein [Bdellovibrionales bacterium]|nr:putative DNA-binding domain-containing protein [Bdellovibrionales bacterium]
MNNAPSLRDLQLWLKWIITDPRGLTEALNNPAPNITKCKDRYTRPTPSYMRYIVGDSAATSIERLDVYAEGYFSRILEGMSESFHRTKKVVGDDAFTKLVAEYLKVYPSKFTSIDEVGYRFASFIAEVDDADLAEWVSDLAHFEWSWIESFYAGEITVTDDWREDLSTNPKVRLQVHPSARLIHSQWSIGNLIEALDSDVGIDSVEVSKRAETGIIIYRFQNEVHWEALEMSIFRLVQDLKNGTPLSDVLAQSECVDPQAISQNFSHWVERGILCGILDLKEKR